MTAIRDVSTMFASMFSLVVFLTLFESRLDKKKTNTLILTLMLPLMAGNFILLLLLGPTVMSTLLLLTCTLPSLCFFLYLSKFRDGRFYFTFFFVDTLILEILYMTSILDFYLGNSYWFMLISRLILCPLLAAAVWKWLRPVYLRLQQDVKTGWGAFAIISLLFYVILSAEISIPTYITQRPEQLPGFLLLLILMPVIYLHFFRTLRQQQILHETDMHEQILQLQVDNMRQRMEEYHDSEQKFRIERHDYRHNLQTIAALVESEDYSSLRNLVAEYTDRTAPALPERYSCHPVLDAVLSAYLSRAREQHIRPALRLSFPDVLPVNETELATVFANALENAIHACEAVPEECRLLEITVMSDPCFMFQIRNSYRGPVEFDADGIPVSPRKNHGFGTRSIVTFCGKNNADYQFKADPNYFHLRISFCDI